jgi:hypothetical protein
MIDAEYQAEWLAGETDYSGEPFEAKPPFGPCDLHGDLWDHSQWGCVGTGPRQFDPVAVEFGGQKKWIYACEPCTDEHWMGV